MPSEYISNFMKNRKLVENVQLQLILQSAPVLKGVKAACMFTVPNGSLRTVCANLYGTQIKMYRLCNLGTKELILVYRPDELERYLNTVEVSTYLKKSGYQRKCLSGDLKYLAARIDDYYKNNHKYPHEMGLFLEYPLEDVIGFVQCAGARYLYLGYWKVYSDVEHAKKKFCAYDSAKEVSLGEYIIGKSVREIAC